MPTFVHDPRFLPRLATLWVMSLSGVSGLLVLGDIAFVLRPFIVMAFFLTCPGMTIIAWLGVRMVEYTIPLAIVLSLVLTMLLATLQLYSGYFSPSLTVGVLVSFCVVGSLLRLWYLRGPA
jgi:hypothetical protein